MMNAFDDVVRVHAQTHFVSKLRGIFKVDAQEYTLNIDQKFIKIKVKAKGDHGFFRKIMEQKAIDFEKYKIN